MAQPWLDSLSEDWNSEPRSSPPGSLSSRNNVSRRVSSNFSQSRIPHLAHNMRHGSNSGYLKPRSTRGIARMKENAALSERSPSSLNTAPKSPSSTGKRQISVTLPRRPSSALFESQNSVQHYTVDKSSKVQDTPEWKRRLQVGDDVTSDGFDLFSPSKLEGIFKQSSCPAAPEDDDEDDKNNDSLMDSGKKPWNSLNLSSFPAPAEHYNTHRSSRAKGPDMATLQEEDEEDSKNVDLSAISSEVARQSDIKGIVKRRVSDFEQTKTTDSPSGYSRTSQDPRMRTISGWKEICNEALSPVEDAECSSIRKQALQEQIDSTPLNLRIDSRTTQARYSQRPDPQASNHDITHDEEASNDQDQSDILDEPVAELTSQSLPEDLSMGTQNPMDSLILGGRRVSTFKNPILRKKSINADTSEPHGQKEFRSSPPPYKTILVEDSRISISEPASPAETSIVHHAPPSTQKSTARSPLKLFGNRDTYTNNKLMRVLSQFEKDESELDVLDETSPLHMSNFGKGELDQFNFAKEVERPVAERPRIETRTDRLFKDINIHKQGGDESQNNSPAKERSPKRRRTLLKDEIIVDGTEVEVKLSSLPENNAAGKKRRDALPGQEAEPASPETLATRPMRRPSGSRRPSRTNPSGAASTAEVFQAATESTPELTKQLAGELETFAKSIVEVKQGSRKPSLGTKDWMAEANKVMQFIRARGKPNPVLPEIQEPEEVSELNPDAILDLELDDSTKESFSRPPSREGRVFPRQDRRHAMHDPQTAEHLMRFRDQEDLELLASTSALGTLQIVDNKAVEEAALVPVPEDDPVELSVLSEPPGMRILNDKDRKRKYSTSEVDAPDSHNSQNMLSDGSKRTILTNTSSGSGQRGVIGIGTVSIPDTVGTMTFDHEKKVWVKQTLQPRRQPAPSASPESRMGRQEASEADPFADIPDLSIDEQRESSCEKKRVSQDDQRLTAIEPISEVGFEDEEKADGRPQQAKVVTPPKSSLKSPRKQRQTDDEDSTRSKSTTASEHEERLHSGLPSKVVENDNSRQPRVVTIAFSSPVASEIPYFRPQSASEEDLDDDDPSLLPLDDDDRSVLVSSPVSSPVKPAENTKTEEDRHIMHRQVVMGSLDRHEQYRAMTLNRRPVSRIEEHDEDQEDNHEMSLIHVTQTEITPMPDRRIARAPSAGKDKSSILCLTPLSEFTLHQIDKVNHPEESYVAERANPKTLRQAHGSHALVEDALVKAITDAEPTELFWEQLRRLSMQNSGLASLHGLAEYCSSLEYLDVRNNKVSQLSELPYSLRSLNVSSNLINDLTSWSHLHNLQVVNVTGNQLESLESFSGLIHLRQLNASHNHIRHIEGILDLNGLISLDLSGNDIAEADFGSCDLPSLEELDLSKNNMMHVKSLECLPNLKHVDLSENLLDELAIKNGKAMTGLETLCMSQNELAEIDLLAFPKLRRLNIDSNMITQVHGLTDAENLSVLSARDQRAASDLVNIILNTRHECVELYLSSNPIPEHGLRLPESPNFTLRCLELSSCGLQSLPLGFGDTFPNLRVLNLNFNAISDLSSLQGSIKLGHLLLARNRIKRMRRTCLTLSRLQALRRIDLRDNPLTIGFYAPSGDEKDEQRPYRLPPRSAEGDQKWIGLMDEMTWLRRRAMELLLTQCCKDLDEVDGMKFDKEELVKEQVTWEKLMGKGVFKRGAELESEKDRDTTVTVNEVAHEPQ